MRTMTLAADSVPRIDPTYSDEELFNLMRLASLTCALGYSLDVSVSYLDANSQGGAMFTTLADKSGLDAKSKAEVAAMTANISKLTKEQAPLLRANAQNIFNAIDRVSMELALRGYDTKWMTLAYQKDTKKLLALSAARSATSFVGGVSIGEVDFLSFMARPFSANLEDFRQCRKRAELMASLRKLQIPTLQPGGAPYGASSELMGTGLGAEPFSGTIALVTAITYLIAAVAVVGAIGVVIYALVVTADTLKIVLPPLMPVIKDALSEGIKALAALVGSFSWLVIALGLAVLIGGILVVPRVIEYAENAWTKHLPRPAGMLPATAATAAAASSLSPVPVGLFR